LARGRPDSEPFLVVSEFQTRWDSNKKLDLALYTLYLKKKYRLRVIPAILLCLPNLKADDLYTDENCHFKFHLVRASEIDARQVFASKELGLYPLLPLLRGGLELVENAGLVLYRSDLDRREKGDLLALLA
jgi:hypothetical protein